MYLSCAIFPRWMSPTHKAGQSGLWIKGWGHLGPSEVPLRRARVQPFEWGAQTSGGNLKSCRCLSVSEGANWVGLRIWSGCLRDAFLQRWTGNIHLDEWPRTTGALMYPGQDSVASLEAWTSCHGKVWSLQSTIKTRLGSIYKCVQMLYFHFLFRLRTSIRSKPTTRYCATFSMSYIVVKSKSKSVLIWFSWIVTPPLKATHFNFIWTKMKQTMTTNDGWMTDGWVGGWVSGWCNKYKVQGFLLISRLSPDVHHYLMKAF